MHILIAANGALGEKPDLPDADLLIAADGGARHFQGLGLRPDILIGDLDSIPAEEVLRLENLGTTVLRLPADKDQTDLELALDEGLRQGGSRFTLLGLFGGRWDMTFANLLLLASAKYHHIEIQAVHGKTRLHILHPGRGLQITGRPGEIVSVIPLDGPLQGLTYRGLEWRLESADLPFGSPRGVSNRLVGETAEIQLSQGTAAVFILPADSDRLSVVTKEK